MASVAKSIDVNDTDFVVSFKYDSSIVSSMRNLPCRRFDGVTKTWTVSRLPENLAPLAKFIENHEFVVTSEAADALSQLKVSAEDLGKLKKVALTDAGIKVATRGNFRIAESLRRKYAPNKEEDGNFFYRWNLNSEELIQYLGDSGLGIDSEVIASYNTFKASIDEEVKSSQATESNLDFPAPEGLAYLGYQKAGISYAMSRKNALIGDEPGLGKTIQAVGVANAMGAKKVLVICPASLKINWSREFAKWTTEGLSVGLVVKNNVPTTNVVILNFDVLKKCLTDLLKIDWDLIIVDEAHAFKNPKAARSKAFYEGGLRYKKLLFLTGTPIVNRPVELQPLLGCLDPENFGDFIKFAFRYCDPKRNAYGWDFKGSENLEELQTKARASVMVRRLKRDVLKDLPAKIRTVVTLDSSAAVAEEKRALAELKKEVQERMEMARILRILDLPNSSILGDVGFEANTIFKIRHATALAKVPAVASFIQDSFEDEKVIIFAHHRDVIKAFKDIFGEAAVTLTGENSSEAKQVAVDRFQNDPSVKFFIGSIQAAGVGLTLTASSNVVFAELDWVPGNMTQAEDRAHRIGQKDSVNVYHVVLSGSIDDRLAATLIEKQRVLDATLDDDVVVDCAPITRTWEAEKVAPVGLNLDVVTREEIASWVQEESKPTQKDSTSATEKVNRKMATLEKSIKKVADTLDAKEIEEVHANLRQLASVCDGALSKDNKGFNASDSRMGTLLASLPSLTPVMAAYAKNMLAKYKKQLSQT